MDANVLIYSADRAAGKRHDVAKRLIAAVPTGSVVLSGQVLSEYANVTTHPGKMALDHDVIAGTVSDFAETFTVVPVTPETVVKALQARARWKLSYYDAQIWATAALAGVEVVLSEDFVDGMHLGPVRFVNPFVEGFDLASLLRSCT